MLVSVIGSMLWTQARSPLLLRDAPEMSALSYHKLFSIFMTDGLSVALYMHTQGMRCLVKGQIAFHMLCRRQAYTDCCADFHAQSSRAWWWRAHSAYVGRLKARAQFIFLMCIILQRGRTWRGGEGHVLCSCAAPAWQAAEL